MNNNDLQLDLFKGTDISKDHSARRTPQSAVGVSNGPALKSQIISDQIPEQKTLEKNLVKLTSPKCQVILFPLINRIHKIRMVAKTYNSRKTEKGKQKFWDQTYWQLQRQLERHGASEKEIDNQLSAFTQAVSQELQLQTLRNQNKENHS